MDKSIGDWKKVLKQVGMSFLFIGIIIVLVKYFHFTIFGIVGTICLYQLIKALYEKFIKRGEFNWKGVLQGWITIILLATLFSFIYRFGWGGFWIDIGITLILIFAFNWKGYIKGIEQVETKIYGHPSKWFKENNLPLPKVRLGGKK